MKRLVGAVLAFTVFGLRLALFIFKLLFLKVWLYVRLQSAKNGFMKEIKQYVDGEDAKILADKFEKDMDSVAALFSARRWMSGEFAGRLRALRPRSASRERFHS